SGNRAHLLRVREPVAGLAAVQVGIPPALSRCDFHDRRRWLADLPLAAPRLPGVYGGRALCTRRSNRDDRMAPHSRRGRREVEGARPSGDGVNLALSNGPSAPSFRERTVRQVAEDYPPA